MGAASLGENGQAYGMQIGQGSRPDDDFVGMYEVIYTGGALTERTSRYRFGTENSLDTGLGSEPDFMALQYRPVMFSSSRAATSALVDGHAWPHPRDMTIAAYGSNIVNGNLDATDDNGTDPTTDLVRLWAERDGTPSAFTATFLGLRILVQRWGS